jgi:hypothetical protein
VPHFKPGKALREAVDAKTAELDAGKEHQGPQGLMTRDTSGSKCLQT